MSPPLLPQSSDCTRHMAILIMKESNEKLHAFVHRITADSQCHINAQRTELGHLGDKEKEG